MKKILFLILSLFLITSACEKITPKRKLTRIDSLKQYAWVSCNLYFRSQYYIYDMEQLKNPCDTFVIYFNDSNRLKRIELCDSTANEFWFINNDYSRLFFNNLNTSNNPENTFIIENITKDTLTLFYVNPEKPDETFEGIVTQFYSCSKERIFN